MFLLKQGGRGPGVSGSFSGRPDIHQLEFAAGFAAALEFAAGFAAELGFFFPH